MEYTFTQSPPPVNGTYGCGETVTCCFTVTYWNATNTNWFHGIEANFGPGWDLATLVPGAPPASCAGTGTWGWYTSVLGTGLNNIGPQGPGFFYNYTLPADGNPGNNFGDFCVGAVNWQFCWTISVLDGPACQNGLGLDISFNTFGDSETGAWFGAGCGSDPVVASTPAVIQSCSVDAGTDGVLAVCSTGQPVSLFTSIGGTPQLGGTWAGPGGVPHGGLLDPSLDAPGIYTYTVTSASPVCSASSTVTVVIPQQPDAGNDGSITLCEGDAPVALISQLGGTPDPGGTWTGPSGPMAGTFTPATDPSGVYTYALVGTPPCTTDLATVTVTVNPSPSAGVNGSLALCSNNAPVALVSGLGGAPDPGGSWSAPDGSVVPGLFDPQTGETTLFTYTVPGVAPCASSTATVNVVVNTLPDAGQDAFLSLCASAGTADLSSLLGGDPDPGGQWSDPSGTSISLTLFLPTAASGGYTYTVAGVAPCPDASAQLDLTVELQPSAGDDATVVLCEESPDLDLFAALDGTPDPGGIWGGPTGPVPGGVFIPGIMPAGDHVYTVSADAPCVNAVAVVSVLVNSTPFAGTDASLQVCATDDQVDLFAQLGAGAQPGGSWTGPAGVAATGTFLPGLSADGTYVYTLAGAAPCPSSTASVTVTTTTPPSIGQPGSLSLCSSDAPVPLFNELGGAPDAGGSWTTPVGAGMNGILDPSTAASGAYTYTLAAVGPCPSSSVQVAVSITLSADAGLDGVLSICSSSPPASLFNALGGSPDAGGTWTAPDGAPQGAIFSPLNDASGLYTYTVPGGATCPSSSSSVTVSVTTAPDAGTGSSASLCADVAPVDPMDWLGGTPDANGVWTGPDGLAVTVVDPATAAAGAYLYTVPGTAPCPLAQSIVQLVIDELPDAGADALLGICADGLPTALIGLLGGADGGGSWSGPDGAATGTFTPGQQPPGVYEYTVSGSGACLGTADAAQVTVQVYPLPVPSFTVTEASGCVPHQVLLTATSMGQSLNAEWTFGDGASASGTLDVSHTYLSAGTYTVTLAVTDGTGCVGTATAPNLILVSDGPDAFFYALPLRMSVDEPSTTLTHEPDPGIAYSWLLDGRSLDTSGVFNWTFDATVGERDICLTATDGLGCRNSQCITVLVDDNLTIHVPNAFTPDADGLNDVFRPAIVGAQEDWYEFLVFDRWGRQVFSTRDPSAGWDGTFQNGGDELPSGVYVWTLKAKDQFTPEKADPMGSVTLLR